MAWHNFTHTHTRFRWNGVSETHFNLLCVFFRFVCFFYVFSVSSTYSSMVLWSFLFLFCSRKMNFAVFFKLFFFFLMLDLDCSDAAKGTMTWGADLESVFELETLQKVRKKSKERIFWSIEKILLKKMRKIFFFKHSLNKEKVQILFHWLIAEFSALQRFNSLI